MRKSSPDANKSYASLNNHARQYSSNKWFEKTGMKNISRSDLAQFLNTYILPVIIGVVLYFPSGALKSYPDKTPFYLVYLIVIVFCIGYSGLAAGLFTTGIILVEILFLFSPLSSQLIFNTTLFIGTAFIVCILIDRARQTREIKKLKKQEKIYAQTFTQLHSEFIKAKADIKARDEFLSIVSHELKTPLTTMLLKLHSILNSVRNVSLAKFSVPELMKVLENAENQTNRMTSMINDLVNVSLITTGRMSLHIEDCDLVKITKHVLQSFSEILKRQKYKVRLYAKSPVVGQWDKVRVEQVITNLVSNAIKYGNNKPIDIKIFNTGGVAKFVIQDRGIGIPRNEQNVLFDLFQRAKGVDKYTRGLGVGLYITSQITRAHGGRIKVSSATQRGSSFTLELPLNVNNQASK